MKAMDPPGAALTLEQRQLVEALSSTLDPRQAWWLSGYFAGFDAGLRASGGTAAGAGAPGSAAIAPPPVATRTLTILYGTETGNAAEVARALDKATKAGGLAPRLIDMADYKPRQLAEEQDLLIVVSTAGEGDAPQPAIGFFEHVEGRRAPRLEGARFAVLALGDTTYEYFCGAGKRLDERLEALGAQRLAPRVDCDVDYEEAAENWTDQMVALLAREAAASAPAPATPAAAPVSAVAPALAAHNKRNPFPAPIVENIPIVGRGSSKETRHVELSLAGSGLVYQPGDALGIAVSNDPAVVEALLDALALSPGLGFEHKGQALTLGEALTHRFEITTATLRFLDYWALLSESAMLRQLQEEERAGERAAFLRTHHIVDIVRRFPVAGVQPQGFVSALRPLQPRLYSLASSLAAVPDEAHLTIAPVRYTLHDEVRSGVASSLIADRVALDDTLPVYVQSNSHFRLPQNDAPIVMIGAGTGVAPYRGFLQEREASGAGGPSWLFFGERNFRTDFLYQTEWQGWLKAGALTRMDVAFSRDGSDKVYVQHRMKEQARDLYDWLEKGAHIYVCGDAAHLAPDVNRALLDIIASEARIGPEAAEDYVRALQADHRYQRDVY